MVVLTEQSSGRSDEAVPNNGMEPAGPRGSCLALASAATVKQKAREMWGFVYSLPLRENCGDAAPVRRPDRGFRRREDGQGGGDDGGEGYGCLNF